MSKKILITGSNGLLGQKLMNLYQGDSSNKIIATARGANRLPFSEGYQFISLDITNREEVDKVIGEVRPDVIINTAAMTNVDQCEDDKEGCWKLNVEAVEYLTDAAVANNAFLLHLSTDFIFDGEDGPYKEDAEPNPISFYGWSKWAAEKYIIHSKAKWAIARTVLVYGIAHDMSRSNIILWAKVSLEQGKTINVVNDQWRTPTLAEDLAKGCALIAEKEATGVFNISGEELLNPFQMATATAEYFKLSTETMNEVDGSSFSQRARRPPRTGFDITKAKEVLGYQPMTFKEGIALLASQLPKA